MPKYIYEGKVYPNYLSGTGYLMDRRTAVLLYQTALTTPLLHLEDVYITGTRMEEVRTAQEILKISFGQFLRGFLSGKILQEKNFWATNC